MAAYVIVGIDVRDPDRFERYKQLAPGAIAHYGGRFLAGGGATEVFEGVGPERRVVGTTTSCRRRSSSSCAGSSRVVLGEPRKRKQLPEGSILYVAPIRALQFVNDGAEDSDLFIYGAPGDGAAES